jgi:hypothetical protein
LEAQQAKDIRRYDLHAACLMLLPGEKAHVYNGMVQLEAHTYTLEVPGLIEGYPPVAKDDVVRLRRGVTQHPACLLIV